MTVVAFLSSKGSPGVTTTACLVGATWPERRRVVVAECDPAGGDLAARFALTSMGGWPTFASAVRRAGSPVELAPHLQQLPGGLDVMVGTHYSEDLTEGRLMSLFLTSASGVSSEPGELSAGRGPDSTDGFFDVVVDLGRLSSASTGADALTDRVDAVVVVIRGDAASVMRAADRSPEIVARWGELAGLVVIGNGRYAATEIEEFVGIPVIGELPFDPRAAAVATGVRPGDRRLLRSPLTQAATRLAGRLAIHHPSADGEHVLSNDPRQVCPHPFLSNMARLRRWRSQKAPGPTPSLTPPGAGQGREILAGPMQSEARR